VHHRTIQINDQPDATVFQVIILTFVYSSTCFGRFSAHHQELNDCSGSLFLPSYRGDSRAVFVVGPAGRPAELRVIIHFLLWGFPADFHRMLGLMPQLVPRDIGRLQVGQHSSVGIATGCGVDGPGLETHWRRDFPHPSRPALRPSQPPVQCHSHR
jgi:hypothetical protein